MEIGPADFINASTKNSQMKHYPCLRYAMIYRPLLKVEIRFSKYATAKQPSISTPHIYVQNKIYVLHTSPEVYRLEKS